MDQTIATWTANDLRRFIQTQVNNDPRGMLPSEVFPPSSATTTVDVTPPAAKDGDFWIYNGTPGLYWRFIYDSTEISFPWKFIGGPPMFAEVLTEQAITSATYAALATPGPSIALPRAGDYEVEIGCFTTSTSGTGTFYYMSYDIGGTGAVDADGVVHAPSGISFPVTQARKRIKTGLSAVTLTAKYKSNDGAKTATFGNRWMSVRPIRVS